MIGDKGKVYAIEPVLVTIELLKENVQLNKYSLVQRQRRNGPYIPIPEIQLTQGDLTSVKLTEESLSVAGCVVIATDYSAYECKYTCHPAGLVFHSGGINRKIHRTNIIMLRMNEWPYRRNLLPLRMPKGYN